MKSNLRLRLILLILIFAIPATIIIVGSWYNNSLTNIEKLLGAPLPIDAAEVHHQYVMGFRDAHFYLRFDSSPASVAAFVEKICGPDSPLSQEYNNAAYSPSSNNPSWWLSDPDRISKSTRCFLPFDTTIFVEEMGSDLDRVYIDGFMN